MIAEAAKAGLDVIALTDHDTTGGWDEAIEARPAGLTIVLGSELSCTVDVPALGRRISMHLLAYGFDPQEPGSLQSASGCATPGWPGSIAGRRCCAKTATTCPSSRCGGRPTPARSDVPHFASLLVEAGLAPSFEEAFGPSWAGGRYRVPRDGWDVYDAIAKVKAAGGVPVFAHPYARLRGPVIGEPEIRRMAAAGLGGLEIDHPDHAPDDRAELRRLAVELDLVVTGSSDYHGSRKTQGLGAETTAPAELERLLGQASGRGVVTDAA